MTIDVSVVIPTKNNARTIQMCLRSIARQTLPPLEVIVVDGNSQDGTGELAKGEGANVRSYDAIGDMRSYARNLGAESASGDWLMFVDSDMELAENLLEASSSLISEGVDAIVIPEVTLGRGLLGRVRAWERGLIQQVPYLVFARMIRTRKFWDVGPFDTSITGFEDLDIQCSLIESRSKILTSSASLVHHEEDQTFGSYLRKRRHYAQTVGNFRDKHPQLSKQIYSPVERLSMYWASVRRPSDAVNAMIATSMRAIEVIPF